MFNLLEMLEQAERHMSRCKMLLGQYRLQVARSVGDERLRVMGEVSRHEELHLQLVDLIEEIKRDLAEQADLDAA